MYEDSNLKTGCQIFEDLEKPTVLQPLHKMFLF
jgi:hypothetical protein